MCSRLVDHVPNMADILVKHAWFPRRRRKHQGGCTRSTFRTTRTSSIHALAELARAPPPNAIHLSFFFPSLTTFRFGRHGTLRRSASRGARRYLLFRVLLVPILLILAENAGATPPRLVKLWPLIWMKGWLWLRAAAGSARAARFTMNGSQWH